MDEKYVEMTNKEQTKRKKITLKDLNDQVEELSRRLLISENKSNVLEHKLKELLGRFEQNKSEKDLVENISQVLNCFKCSNLFKTRRQLKKHIKEMHSVLYDCKDCDSKFDEMWKLENHLKSHQKIKDNKCNKCEKTFYTEWRLKKHKAMHENESVRKCHYFNNDKPCPFDEIGCMFLHVRSSRCYFSSKCTRKLCPYFHVPMKNGINEASTKSDASVEESVSENDIEQISEFNCDIDELTSYHEEDADKSIDIDNLCDKVLQNTSMVFNDGEEDILSDSFIDNLILQKEQELRNLNAGDMKHKKENREEDYNNGTF